MTEDETTEELAQALLLAGLIFAAGLEMGRGLGMAEEHLTPKPPQSRPGRGINEPDEPPDQPVQPVQGRSQEPSPLWAQDRNPTPSAMDEDMLRKLISMANKDPGLQSLLDHRLQKLISAEKKKLMEEATAQLESERENIRAEIRGELEDTGDVAGPNEASPNQTEE